MTLLVLAAGMGSRYGSLKQLDPMGPSGEAVLDYSVFDAARSGFTKVVFVIRKSFDQEFRNFIGDRYADQIEVAYAWQELDDLPHDYQVPSDREKPWGTAHAVYVARHEISGPFAVINADDFYGRLAFERMAKFLNSTNDKTYPANYCMVGFELRNTLSEFGTVSRGLCKSDETSSLQSVREIVGISKTAEGAEFEEDGKIVPLSGNEIVSMNMWGFTPSIFGHIENCFENFFQSTDDPTKGEFYIPTVVDQLIEEGKAVTKVLESPSKWFGVTYLDDKPHVVASIQALVERGDYPKQLWPEPAKLAAS